MNHAVLVDPMSGFSFDPDVAVFDFEINEMTRKLARISTSKAKRHQVEPLKAKIIAKRRELSVLLCSRLVKPVFEIV